MQRKLTITIDDAVYKGLHKVIGRGKISEFIENLLRPHVVNQALNDAYRDMASEVARERDAFDWIESLTSDANDESR